MAIKRAYGWSDIDTDILGMIPIHINSIEYKKTKTKTNGYGRGSNPTRRGHGNSEYTCSMNLGMEAVVAIELYISEKYGEGFDLTDVEPFDIPVTYNNGVKVVQDIIRDFEWTEVGRGSEQGAEFIDQDLPGICSGIDFNVLV